jgi:CubicO group peptidase (beta-lactamase class C family)
MTHTSLENWLQNEMEALVTENDDVFNPIMGITTTRRDFYWCGAAGKAYAERPDPMEVDSPFFIASVTKMFTAAAIMILEERERLSLEDPVAKYLPESIVDGLHVYKGRDYSQQLTIYHLLSQTSGLPDYFTGKPKGEMSVFERLIAEGDFSWGLEQVVDITRNSLSPKFPPQPVDPGRSRRKAFYSDTNYQLLGAILESAAGKSLQEVYFELIIEQLGLKSTYLHGYGDTQATTRKPATIYYRKTPIYLDQAMTAFGPDGGIVSTLEDCLHFVHNLMQGNLFMHPQTLERMKNWNRIFYPFQYGFGLMRIKLPKIFSPFSANPELVGHSGATSAFLFKSEPGGILIGGTLNQIDNQARPVRLLIKMVDYVNKALS